MIVYKWKGKWQKDGKNNNECSRQGERGRETLFRLVASKMGHFELSRTPFTMVILIKWNEKKTTTTEKQWLYEMQMRSIT